MESYSFKNVDFTYPEGEKKALRNISFTVQQGEFSPRFDTAEKIDSELIEFYVVAQDYSWTYIKTHEGDGCGPYFLRNTY